MVSFSMTSLGMAKDPNISNSLITRLLVPRSSTANVALALPSLAVVLELLQPRSLVVG